MEEAEEFAKKFPVFAKQILENKYTGNEDWINFGSTYKKIYFKWDIRRGLYKTGTPGNVSNYRGKSYTKFLFCLYVNTYSLFDHHYSFDLDRVAEKIDLFHYDNFNSTFYATDEQVIPLLDKLSNWYVKAQKENKVLLQQKQIEKAKELIKEAKKTLKSLTNSPNKK